MNRRDFLKSLGVATAALYLRFAPSLAQAVQAIAKTEQQENFVVFQSSHLTYHGLAKCRHPTLETEIEKSTWIMYR